MVVDIEEHEIDFHDVALLPDGNGVGFVNHQRNPENGDWLDDSAFFVLRDGERHKVVIDPGILTIHGPVYSSGHLLYERVDAGQGIWAVPFSPAKLETMGEPFLVVAGAEQPSVASGWNPDYLPATDGDALPEIQLVWVDRQGRELGLIGGPRQQHHQFSLSPDGKRIAISAGEEEDELDIWIHDLERRGLYQLTHEEGPDLQTAWSADGRTIYYLRDPPDCRNPSCLEFVARPSDGSGTAEVIGKGGFVPSPTPDDSAIVFTGISKDGTGLFRLPLDASGSRASLLIEETGFQYYARFSPDGTHFAYMSRPKDGVDVFLAPYPNTGSRWQVSMEGGEWRSGTRRATGSTSSHGFDVMEVEVSYDPAVRLSRPTKLFTLQNHQFDGGPMGGTPFFGVTGGRRAIRRHPRGRERPAGRSRHRRRSELGPGVREPLRTRVHNSPGF